MKIVKNKEKRFIVINDLSVEEFEIVLQELNQTLDLFNRFSEAEKNRKVFYDKIKHIQ